MSERIHISTLAAERIALRTGDPEVLSLATIAAERIDVASLVAGRMPLATIAAERIDITSLVSTEAAPPVALPPVNITPPVASGVVRIGQVLSSDDGVWTNSPTGYTYQWTRDNVAIGGEVANTYTTVAADVDAEIRCEVTATNAGGSSAPEPSNALTSPWRPILLARPGVLIWDGQDPYCYGGAGVGAPVEELYTVDGLLLATQTITSKQATRTSGGTLDFDGLDDLYVGGAAYAAYLQEDCTYCLGADGLTSAAGEWCLHAIPSAGVASPYLWHYLANTATITRNQTRLSDTGAQILGLLGAEQDLAVTWRVGTPGYGALYDLAAGVTLAGSVAVNVVAKTFGYWTLGGNNLGTTTWQGNLRHACFGDAEWSSADLGTYRACALAAGVM